MLQALKKLSAFGVTIVTVIHQPRYSIFKMFDSVRCHHSDFLRSFYASIFAMTFQLRLRARARRPQGDLVWEIWLVGNGVDRGTGGRGTHIRIFTGCGLPTRSFFWGSVARKCISCASQTYPIRLIPTTTRSWLIHLTCARIAQAAAGLSVFFCFRVRRRKHCHTSAASDLTCRNTRTLRTF